MHSRVTRLISGNFATQSISLGIALVGTIITSRELGPDGRGVVAIVTLMPTLGASVLSLGLNTAIVRFIASGKLTLTQAAQNAAVFTIAASAVGILAWALCRLFNPALLPPALVSFPRMEFSLVLYLLGIVDLFVSSLLQGCKDVPALNRAQIWSSLALLAFLAVLVSVFEMGVLGALLSYLASSLTKITINSCSIWRNQATLRFAPQAHSLASLVSYAMRCHVGNIVQLVNYRFDMIALSHVASDSQVGIYSVATRIAELLWLFPKSVSFVHFAEASSGSTSQRSLRLQVAATAAIVLLSGALLAVVARQLIRLVFGEEFVDATRPLFWLIPGVAALGCTKILSADLAGRGHPGLNSICAALGCVITVLATIPLYRIFGITGAAMASSISYITIASCVGYFHLRTANSSRADEGSAS
jgi:O-antigen/teichoic acid export membrane protein